MASFVAPQGALVWELLMPLGIGVAVVVALAALAGRVTVSAVWQAAIWRIATVSLFLLLALELTGLGQAVARLCRQRVGQSRARSLEKGERQEIAQETRGTAIGAISSMHRLEARPANSPLALENRNLPAVVTHYTADADGRTSLATSEATGLVSDTKSNAHQEHLVPVADNVLVAPASPALSWWLTVIWTMGTVTVLGWFVVGRVVVCIFRRSCTRFDEEGVLVQVAALRAELGIRRTVAMLTSPRVAAPSILGGWWPALVLPPQFACDFDTRQQGTILAHELAHLASRDAAWQKAALLLCSLLWWHPLAWWSRRRLRAAHEALADEASLVIPDGPRILAEALVLIGQRLIGVQPQVGLSLGGGHFRSGLGRRVERLLNLARPSSRPPRRARLAFAYVSLPVLMALAAIIGTAWAPSQIPSLHGETTMSVLSNSWSRSLVATALWTMLATPSASVTADDQPAQALPAAADREKVEQELQSMKQKVQQLEKDGKHEEAEKVKHKAYAIYRKIATNPSAVTTPGGPEREKVRQQWLVLRDEIEKATKEGKADEVQSLRQQAEAMRARLYMQANVGPVPPQSDGNREARLQHLRSAVENLRAAGCESEAQHVAQMVYQIQAEGSGQGTHPALVAPPGSVSASAPSGYPASSSAYTGVYVGPPVVQELRSQVEQMRCELRELREQLNQMKSSEHK